jgi:hypothetical protein
LNEEDHFPFDFLRLTIFFYIAPASGCSLRLIDLGLLRGLFPRLIERGSIEASVGEGDCLYVPLSVSICRAFTKSRAILVPLLTLLVAVQRKRHASVLYV